MNCEAGQGGLHRNRASNTRMGYCRKMKALLLFIVTSSLASAKASAQDMTALTPQTFAKPSVSLEHQDVNIEEQKLSFGVPIYRGSESGWAFTGRAQRVSLGNTLKLPASGTRIPKEFGSADFGLSWSHEDLAGNKTGAGVTYGDAGTRLFSGDNPAVISATGFIERKKADHSWLYFLSYSNNRTVLNNIPIPGIAYAISRTTYSALFGLPFAFVNWRPDPWMLTAMLSPFGASLEGAHRFWGPLQSFANLNWSPKSYANLVKKSDDRLLYDKKEAGAGLRLMLGKLGSVSAAYVYAFDRRFLLGKSLSERGAESIDIEDTSGLQIKTKFSF